MNRIDQQHKSISQAGKHFNMDFARIANEMENRLKEMGIEILRSGPRLSDPAHLRGEDAQVPISPKWQDNRDR